METFCLDKVIPINSRYGRGIAVKFISLWMRGENGDFVFPPDVAQMYFLVSADILISCYTRCGLDIETASALEFLDYDSHKYFTSQDICFFLLYIKTFVEENRSGRKRLQIKTVQEILKKEKEERKIK